MITFTNLPENKLELVKPKFLKENYELRSGGSVLGTMQMTGFFTRNAEILIDNQKWLIKKESILKGVLGVYKFGNELPSFKYVPVKMKRGEIHLSKGEYLVVKSYFLKGIIEVMDKYERILFTLDARSGLSKKYIIELKDRISLIEENPWIVFLVIWIKIDKERTGTMYG